MPSQAPKAVPVPAEPAPRETRTAFSPIRLHSSPIAQVARHLHPVLLLSLLSLGFKNLVADPVASMINALPLVVAVQVVYSLLCLPIVGSQGARKLRPGEKKANADAPNVAVTVFVSVLLSVFVAPLFHAIMVLFGAPVLTHVPHTLLCSLHLSLLALPPLFYARGVDSAAWGAITSLNIPCDETLGGLFGGVVGAWLGAVPIPLDWDREWQRWPIPILCGVYGGYIVGKVVGGTLLFGKKY